MWAKVVQNHWQKRRGVGASDSVPRGPASGTGDVSAADQAQSTIPKRKATLDCSFADSQNAFGIIPSVAGVGDECPLTATLGAETRQIPLPPAPTHGDNAGEAVHVGLHEPEGRHEQGRLHCCAMAGVISSYLWRAVDHCGSKWRRLGGCSPWVCPVSRRRCREGDRHAHVHRRDVLRIGESIARVRRVTSIVLWKL